MLRVGPLRLKQNASRPEATLSAAEVALYAAAGNPF